jgi:hypothetical protein
LIALAWPSLGPLPWLVVEVVPHAHAGARAEGGADHAHEHHHADASAIPGSPTHPADHDCAECKVLKHLARCVPSAATLPFMPSPVAGDIPSRRVASLPVAQAATYLPPVRAPPAVG